MFSSKKNFEKFLESISGNEDIFYQLKDLFASIKISELSDYEKIINFIDKYISEDNDLIDTANERIRGLSDKINDDSLDWKTWGKYENEYNEFNKKRDLFLYEKRLLEHTKKHLRYKKNKIEIDNKFFENEKPDNDLSVTNRNKQPAEADEIIIKNNRGEIYNNVSKEIIGKLIKDIDEYHRTNISFRLIAGYIVDRYEILQTELKRIAKKQFVEIISEKIAIDKNFLKINAKLRKGSNNTEKFIKSVLNAAEKLGKT